MSTKQSNGASENENLTAHKPISEEARNDSKEESSKFKENNVRSSDNNPSKSSKSEDSKIEDMINSEPSEDDLKNIGYDINPDKIIPNDDKTNSSKILKDDFGEASPFQGMSTKVSNGDNEKETSAEERPHEELVSKDKYENSEEANSNETPMSPYDDKETAPEFANEQSIKDIGRNDESNDERMKEQENNYDKNVDDELDGTHSTNITSGSDNKSTKNNKTREAINGMVNNFYDKNTKVNQQAEKLVNNSGAAKDESVESADLQNSQSKIESVDNVITEKQDDQITESNDSKQKDNSGDYTSEKVRNPFKWDNSDTDLSNIILEENDTENIQDSSYDNKTAAAVDDFGKAGINMPILRPKKIKQTFHPLNVSLDEEMRQDDEDKDKEENRTIGDYNERRLKYLLSAIKNIKGIKIKHEDRVTDSPDFSGDEISGSGSNVTQENDHQPDFVIIDPREDDLAGNVDKGSGQQAGKQNIKEKQKLHYGESDNVEKGQAAPVILTYPSNIANNHPVEPNPSMKKHHPGHVPINTLAKVKSIKGKLTKDTKVNDENGAIKYKKSRPEGYAQNKKRINASFMNEMSKNVNKTSAKISASQSELKEPYPGNTSQNALPAPVLNMETTASPSPKRDDTRKEINPKNNLMFPVHRQHGDKFLPQAVVNYHSGNIQNDDEPNGFLDRVKEDIKDRNVGDLEDIEHFMKQEMAKAMDYSKPNSRSRIAEMPMEPESHRLVRRELHNVSPTAKKPTNKAKDETSKTIGGRDTFQEPSGILESWNLIFYGT